MNVDADDTRADRVGNASSHRAELNITLMEVVQTAGPDIFSSAGEASGTSYTNVDDSGVSNVPANSLQSPLTTNENFLGNYAFVQTNNRGGGLVSANVSMPVREKKESTPLLPKDEVSTMERRYSLSEEQEEIDKLYILSDLELGKNTPILENDSNERGVSQGHRTSYLGRTITKLAQSSHIEDIISSVSDFLFSIWSVQGYQVGDEEPSNQGLLREIIASFNRLFENIGAGAMHGWDHSSEFFANTWSVFEERVKSLEPQGWINFFFSFFIVILVSILIAQSNFVNSYHQSTDLTIQQLNKVIQKMQETQGEYQATVTLKISRLKSFINDLQSDLFDVRNNETSTTALNAKFADLQNNVNDQITSNNAYISEKVHEATDNVTVNIGAMKAYVERDLDNYRQKFYSESGLFSKEVESARNSTQSEINAMNRLMTKVQKEMEGYQNDTNNEFLGETNFVKFQLAGTFMLLACLCSGWHLGQHKTNLKNIEAQKRVMAILWMVPIYSVTSWISLVSAVIAPYAGAVRDCYEAYAIYTFVALLVAVMEDGKGLSALVERLSDQVKSEIQDEQEAIKNEVEPPARHLLPPFPCGYARTKPYSIASTWIFQCKLLAMQFVLLNPVIAVSPLILGVLGVNVNAPSTNVDGTVNWSSLQLWCAILQNVSICVAFWGLWVFYHGTIRELEWCNPWPKFLCIKGIVFMTYYQAIVIDILSAMGSFSMSAASSYQNLLICIEMFLFAIAHVYIFPVDEWDKEKREALKKDEKRIKFGDTFAMPEFFSDVRQIVTVEDFYLKGKEEKALECTEEKFDENGNTISYNEGNNSYEYSCFCFPTDDHRDLVSLSVPGNENKIVGTVTLSHKKLSRKPTEESCNISESNYNESESEDDEVLELPLIEGINSQDLIGFCPDFQHVNDEEFDVKTYERIIMNKYDDIRNVDNKETLWNSSNLNLEDTNLPQRLPDQRIEWLDHDHLSPSQPGCEENNRAMRKKKYDNLNASSSKGRDLLFLPQSPVGNWKSVVSRQSAESSMAPHTFLESERVGLGTDDCPSNVLFAISNIDECGTKSIVATSMEFHDQGMSGAPKPSVDSIKLRSHFEAAKGHQIVNPVDYDHEEIAFDSVKVDNVDRGALVPEVVVSQVESSSILEQNNLDTRKDAH